MCYVGKWIKGDQGVSCRYPRAVKSTAKFAYVIRYLQWHGITTEQHTVTGMQVL